jgi:hypothetical protein
LTRNNFGSLASVLSFLVTAHSGLFYGLFPCTFYRMVLEEEQGKRRLEEA